MTNYRLSKMSTLTQLRLIRITATMTISILRQWRSVFCEISILWQWWSVFCDNGDQYFATMTISILRKWLSVFCENDDQYFANMTINDEYFATIKISILQQWLHISILRQLRWVFWWQRVQWGCSKTLRAFCCWFQTQRVSHSPVHQNLTKIEILKQS